MHMITIFLILKRIHINSLKPPKTLLQYNFLVPPNEEGFVLWRKVNPQIPPLPFFSISSTYSFLFSQAFPSLPLQTCKQSLRDGVNVQKVIVVHLLIT